MQISLPIAIDGKFLKHLPVQKTVQQILSKL